MTSVRAACVAFLLLSVAYGALGATLEAYLADLKSSTATAIDAASVSVSLSGTIPNDIHRFKLLTSFKLTVDTTSQNVSGTIPHNFCKLTNLEDLYIYKTRISGASGGGEIPQKTLSPPHTSRLWHSELVVPVLPDLPRVRMPKLRPHPISIPLPPASSSSLHLRNGPVVRGQDASNQNARPDRLSH